MKSIHYKDKHIFALSDTHGYHKLFKVPPCDILIHAGDFSAGVGTASEAFHFADWMMCQEATHKILVPGNHDCQIEQDVGHYKHSFLEHGIHMLVDEYHEAEGMSFFGSPWTVEFYNWSFMKTEEELAEMYDKFPRDMDVLITHGPPEGFLDYYDGNSCGSNALLDYITGTTAKHHIFGHIHEARGEHIIEWTNLLRLHNVACAELIQDLLKQDV